MNKQQIILRQLKSLHEIFLNLRKLFLHLPKKHRLIIIATSLFLLLLMILPTEQELTTQEASNQGFEVGKRYQVAMPQKNTGSPTDKTIEILSIK